MGFHGEERRRLGGKKSQKSFSLLLAHGEGYLHREVTSQLKEGLLVQSFVASVAGDLPERRPAPYPYLSSAEQQPFVEQFATMSLSLKDGKF